LEEYRLPGQLFTLSRYLTAVILWGIKISITVILPIQQPAPYLLESTPRFLESTVSGPPFPLAVSTSSFPPPAVSTYVYPPAGSTTLLTSTASTALLPLAVTAVATSTASLASNLYTPLVTMVSTPLSISAVPTSFVAAAPSSVVAELSSPPETLSSTSTPPPVPLPVGFNSDSTYLPSSAIAKELLKSIDQVLAENNRYVDDLNKHVGTLSQVLAFFGKDVMLQCKIFCWTTKGRASVANPKYRTCPIHFEPIWKKCVTAIEMACCHQRNKEDKNKSELFIVNYTVSLGLLLQFIVQTLYKLLNKNIPCVTEPLLERYNKSSPCRHHSCDNCIMRFSFHVSFIHR